MPVAERDFNASGRTSRASDMSTASRGPSRASEAYMKSDLLSTGITSMLRTSTEMGNLGGLTLDSHRVPNVPRVQPRRGGATSRLSAASSHSAHSSRKPGHRQLPSSASIGTRRSRENNVPQYVADTLSPTVMHLPGSSPLIPRAGRPREGNRSQSLTTAHTSEPSFPLSQHRSMTSIRSLPRPGSRGYNYGYPAPPGTRVPGHRAASPAFSDTTGLRPRSRNGYGPGYAQQPRPMQRRMPSDASLRRNDRGFALEGPYPRAQTPTYYGDIGPGIPPVPLISHHRRSDFESSAVSHHSHRSQKSHRSAKGSFSSGSFNQRNDSDPPSSDATFPSTPQGNASMERLTGTQYVHRVMPLKEEPAYYDGSEQFHEDADSNLMPTGGARRIKTILEERGSPDQVVRREEPHVTTEHAVDTPSSAFDIPELPASPVPRRITRDMVRSVIGPASDIESSGGPVESKSLDQSAGSDRDETTTIGTARQGRFVSSLKIEEVDLKRPSILSQADTSILNSSTFEFAVQTSIPTIADKGITMDTEEITAPVAEPEIEPTTEDGISDLLDGYQHTDTKPDDGQTVEADASAVKRADKRSKHAAKSSDEQSFKSCTDRPELTEHSRKGDAIAVRSSDELPLPDPPFKDSDAKSFKTCRDTVTPDRAMSLPPPRLSSSNLVVSKASERRFMRPVPETAIPSSLVYDPKQLSTSRSESNVANAGTRSRGDSRSNLGSATPSSSSLVPENGVHQPPVVPPRQSSSGKEAQRSSAMFNNFLAAFRGRSGSGTSRRAAKKEASENGDQHDARQDIPTPPAVRGRPVSGTANVMPQEMVEPLKVPDSVLKKQQVLGQTPLQANFAASSCKPSSELRSGTSGTPGAVEPNSSSQRGFDTPSSRIQQPSSVYSPNDISSWTRTNTPPARSPSIPMYSRRDSETTTHLSYPPRHAEEPSRPPRSGCIPVLEPYLPIDQEDKTTDLKSVYYPPYAIRNRNIPRSYLPDVKEESHEDSSLNTSASNLRHSSYRVGISMLPDVQETHLSLDVEGFSRGRTSLQPSMHERFDGKRFLPELEFSQGNLLSDMDFNARGSRTSRSLDLPREGCGQDGNGLEDSESEPSAKRRRNKYFSVFRALDTTNATQRESGYQLFHKRPLSPKLAKDLEDFRIPSIDGLTKMIGEVLPTFKDLHPSNEGVNATGEVIDEAIEQIHEVGAGPANKRSSARLRALPGSPQMAVVDDDVYERNVNCQESGGKVSQSDCENVIKRELGVIGATKGRSWSVAHTRTRDSNPLEHTTTVLQAPPPAVLPARSVSLGHQNKPRPSSESRPSSSSLHPSTPTAGLSDPFNFSKYCSRYLAQDLQVDIKLPSSTPTRSSPRHGPSHLRQRVSDASTAGTLTAEDTSFSPNSLARALHVQQDWHRPLSRSPRQDHNSTSEPGVDVSGFAPAPVHVRDNDHSHVAGERYPTSALTLPPHLHLAVDSSNYSLAISDDELEAPSSNKTRFGRKSRRITKTQAAPRDSTRIKELHRSGNLEKSVDQSTEVPTRNHRNTFTGVTGMSKLGYFKSTFVQKVKAFGRKVADRVRNLRHRGSSNEPVPTVATAPTSSELSDPPTTRPYSPLPYDPEEEDPRVCFYGRPPTGNDSGSFA